jgi:hypothetical protein
MKRELGHLDKGEVLAGLLLGILMVLILSLAAGCAVQTTRAMLMVTVACIAGWGVIDGLMHLAGAWMTRVRRAEFIRDVRAANHGESERMAGEVIQNALDRPATPVDLQAMSRMLVEFAHRVTPPEARLIAGDWKSVFTSFALLVVTTIPTVLPYLFIPKLFIARRVANVLLVAMLFLIGRIWASHAGLNPVRTGAGLAIAGTALVGIAALLGG